MTVLGIIIVTLASAGLVWLVDLCCRHELAMLEQRARNGEANGSRGGDQLLGFHDTSFLGLEGNVRDE
ncbi:hypothetical protein [Sphingomonas sp. PvP018]|uniref:hypothetical protein n=1 Tax=Sphingomonas sp. PvP018 TaxID=2817852 RepID=UPI001AE65111|nr:hypothetical protein [Sphingomonas sp. PvP018]MBP2512178.1 hypothetical protein [Sphingomonas sp. PvP018]